MDTAGGATPPVSYRNLPSVEGRISFRLVTTTRTKGPDGDFQIILARITEMYLYVGFKLK
jgi:hypothetical protein